MKSNWPGIHLLFEEKRKSFVYNFIKYDFVDEKWIENITSNIPDDCTQEEINNAYAEYQKDLEFWSTWRQGRDGF